VNKELRVERCVTSLIQSYPVPKIMPQGHTHDIKVMLEAFQTLTLDGGEWPASQSNCFTHKEKENP
jgi:hypothetical protein